MVNIILCIPFENPLDVNPVVVNWWMDGWMTNAMKIERRNPKDKMASLFYLKLCVLSNVNGQTSTCRATFQRIWFVFNLMIKCCNTGRSDPAGWLQHWWSAFLCEPIVVKAKKIAFIRLKRQFTDCRLGGPLLFNFKCLCSSIFTV